MHDAIGLRRSDGTIAAEAGKGLACQDSIHSPPDVLYSRAARPTAHKSGPQGLSTRLLGMHLQWPM